MTTTSPGKPQTTDLLKRGGTLSTPEKAQRAVKVFRHMQPTLNSYARALTGRRDVQVVMAVADNGSTDGKNIYFRPPIGLGNDTPHDRMLCQKRGTDGLQLCSACAVRESVLVTIYHEINHIAFDTFSSVTDADKVTAINFALREHKGKYADQIRQRIDAMPSWKINWFGGLAGVVNEFLPTIVNALEDARVNGEGFKARPGLRHMFYADEVAVFESGFEASDGAGGVKTVRWAEAPLNSQAIIALFCMASGYKIDGWFRPEIDAVIEDPALIEMTRMEQVRTARDVFTLSFNVLARLRELGFCGTPQDPDPEPEEEESEGSDEATPEDVEDQESPEERGGQQSDAEGGPGEGDREGEGEQSDDEPEGGSGQGECPTPGDSDESESDRESDTGASGTEGEVDDAEDAVEEGEGEEAESGSAGGTDSGGSDEGGEPSEDGGDGGVPPQHQPDQGHGEADPSEDGAEGSGSDPGEGPSEGADPAEGSGSVDEAGSADGSHDAEGSHDADGDAGSPEGGALDEPSDDELSGDGDPDPEGDGTQNGESKSGAGSDRGSPAEDDAPEGADAQGSGQGTAAGDDLDESRPTESGDPGLDDLGEAGTPGTSAGEAGVPAPDAQPEPEGEADRGRTPAATESDGQVPERGDGPSPEGLEGEDDTPLDSGADDGYGGTRVDGPNDADMGTAEEAEIMLQQWNMHQEKPKSIGEEAAEKDEAEAMATAVIQGLYFTKPSVNVFGVREHDFDNLTAHSQAWTKTQSIRYGGVADLDIPEVILQPAVARTRRAFSDNQRGELTRNLKRGRVDHRNLGRRAPTGDDRLFGKRTLPGARSYEVIIGMDVSGSTVGVNLALEKRAIWAQAELLNRVGIPFSIYAHTGAQWGEAPAASALALQVYHVKRPHETWKQAQPRLKRICHSSANLDGHALEYLRARADESRATDKIILYYTDGKMPQENHDEELEILRREIRTCKSKGYVLLGVGIRTDSPIRHGLDTVQMDTDDDLIKVVKHLEKRISSTISTR